MSDHLNDHPSDALQPIGLMLLGGGVVAADYNHKVAAILFALGLFALICWAAIKTYAPFKPLGKF